MGGASACLMRGTSMQFQWQFAVVGCSYDKYLFSCVHVGWQSTVGSLQTCFFDRSGKSPSDLVDSFSLAINQLYFQHFFSYIFCVRH